MSKRLRKYIFSSTGLYLGCVEVNPTNRLLKAVAITVILIGITYGILHIPMPEPRVKTNLLIDF
jgi:hypothetical protein